MKVSTDRILTTHVGSLPRPPLLEEMLLAKEKGDWALIAVPCWRPASVQRSPTS